MYLIRKAQPNDIPFLVNCILAAESHAGKSTYELMFDLKQEEVRNLLIKIFEEEIENQEICLQSFAVIEYNHQLIAGCAGWIEGREGISSGTLKATALSYLIPDKLINNPKVNAIAEVNIPRTNGAIQLESFYTITEFRGKKLSHLLIDFHIGTLKNKNIHYAEIITVNNNHSALRSYQNANFKIIENTVSENPLVLEILGGTGKTLLRRKL